MELLQKGDFVRAADGVGTVAFVRGTTVFVELNPDGMGTSLATYPISQLTKIDRPVNNDEGAC